MVEGSTQAESLEELDELEAVERVAVELSDRVFDGSSLLDWSGQVVVGSWQAESLGDELVDELVLVLDGESVDVSSSFLVVLSFGLFGASRSSGLFESSGSSGPLGGPPPPPPPPPQSRPRHGGVMPSPPPPPPPPGYRIPL
ncbi:MAG: hypothetical protein Q9209_007192 [Squamulea sp. 1 TL-2023]